MEKAVHNGTRKRRIERIKADLNNVKGHNLKNLNRKGAKSAKKIKIRESCLKSIVIF